MERSQLQTRIREEGPTNCLLLCSCDAQEEMTTNSLVLSSYSVQFSVIHYFAQRQTPQSEQVCVYMVHTKAQNS